MPEVICLGSALKDIFMPTGDGTVTETPEDITSRRKITFELGAKYRIENRYAAAGGCALNTAIALARLGVSSAPYALVGGDATGSWIKQTLINNNVDVSLIRQVSEAQSDLSMILVDRRTGERVIFVNRDLGETLVVDEELLSRAETLFLGSLSGRWRENFALVADVVAAGGCDLAYNPGQSNMAEDIDLVFAMIKRSKFLSLNRDEAMEIGLRCLRLSRKEVLDPAILLEKFAALGPETVVVTGGLEGAWLCGGGKKVFVPSSGEKPLDTTGAGDAFGAGALAAILRGEDITVAAAWGALNASEVIRHYGSNEGLLCLSAMRRLQEAVLEKVEII